MQLLTQNLFVDGYRALRDDQGDEPLGWSHRNRNGLAAVHRATLKYGWSYTTVLPGETAPVIRGVSPRDTTAACADDVPLVAAGQHCVAANTPRPCLWHPVVIGHIIGASGGMSAPRGFIGPGGLHDEVAGPRSHSDTVRRPHLGHRRSRSRRGSRDDP
ncbi:hypothetical protein DMH03_24030 [Amycolatopsis sp. WAC 01376]|nr:hypothetical protein DMH03_24030 [Amycolatopsis sp. WAC 01376]